MLTSVARHCFVLGFVVLLWSTLACAQSAPAPGAAAHAKPSPRRPAKAALYGLALERHGFQTHLTRRESAKTPVEVPPSKLFLRVNYPAQPGEMAAYVTPDPRDGARHPAIVWITGGDYSTIGNVWKEGPASNEQTASAYRKAGIVMMFPSQRGGNQNPGVHEGFLGEVDDVLAARDYLATLPYVDTSRIYLGGHSTGGTLALLAMESTDQFRAAFCFGPVDQVALYGPPFLYFDTTDQQELRLRSPGLWLDKIRRPTFVIEGAGEGNRERVEFMQTNSRNSLVHFLIVPGFSHFSVLAPVNALIASKILADSSASSRIYIKPEEIR